MSGKIKFVPILMVLFPLLVNATTYPQLDTFSGFGANQIFDGLSGVTKRVNLSSTTFTDKYVFNFIGITGIKIDGQVYPLSNSGQLLSQGSNALSNSNGTNYWYNYSFGSYTVKINYELWKDGKFYVVATLLNGANTQHNVEVYWYADYDLDGASNDAFEFAWNRQSQGGLIPPAVTPNLSYVATNSKSYYDFWSSVPNEVQISYPALGQTGGIDLSQTIENMGIARLFNAGPNGSQFGATFWEPYFGSISLNFQAYSYRSPGAPKAPNSSNNIQVTEVDYNNSPSKFPRYAVSGSDQILAITHNYCCAWPGDPVSIGGKVWQKPGYRPLVWNVRSHSGIPSFDPYFYIVGTRNARLALEELLGNSPLQPDVLTTRYSSSSPGGSATVPYISPTPGTNGFPAAGGNVTEAQLHNLMYFGQNREYTIANRENVNTWTVDIFLVNWRDASDPSNTLGLMFDYGGSAGANNITREAAAVYWPTHSYYGTGNTQLRQATQTILHEGGHCLNFGHAHSSCHGPVGGPCTANPPVVPTLMSYYRYSSAGHQNGLYYNAEDPSPANFNEDRNERRFYQQAPEAWVKPGRNGTIEVLPQFDVEYPFPHYITN